MQFRCDSCHLLVEATHVDIAPKPDGSCVATCKCPTCGQELTLSQHIDDDQAVDLRDALPEDWNRLHSEWQSKPERGSARVFPASNATVSSAWSLSNAESAFVNESRGAVAEFERASEVAGIRHANARSQAAKLSDEASQLEQRARVGITKARADCGWGVGYANTSMPLQTTDANVSDLYEALKVANRRISRMSDLYKRGVKQRAAATNWKIALAVGAILAVCVLLTIASSY